MRVKPSPTLLRNGVSPPVPSAWAVCVALRLCLCMPSSTFSVPANASPPSTHTRPIPQGGVETDLLVSTADVISPPFPRLTGPLPPTAVGISGSAGAGAGAGASGEEEALSCDVNLGRMLQFLDAFSLGNPSVVARAAMMVRGAAVSYVHMCPSD
jgi:hypothetical protein